MKWFLDTEFYERPGSIELISVGLVSLEGAEFYVENADFDWAELAVDATFAHPSGDTPRWLIENVMPHLSGDALTPEEIAYEIRLLVGNKPEFYGWYSSYDWVVFCWLQGRMIDLPKGLADVLPGPPSDGRGDARRPGEPAKAGRRRAQRARGRPLERGGLPASAGAPGRGVSTSRWDTEAGVVMLHGCALLTPKGAEYFERVEADLARARERVAKLEYEFLSSCEDGRCDLDLDGCGGRATHCRRCRWHPLRAKGDPSDLIARYLGDA